MYVRQSRKKQNEVNLLKCVLNALFSCCFSFAFFFLFLLRRLDLFSVPAHRAIIHNAFVSIKLLKENCHYKYAYVYACRTRTLKYKIAFGRMREEKINGKKEKEQLKVHKHFLFYVCSFSRDRIVMFDRAVMVVVWP